MNNSIQNIPYEKDDDYIECCKITFGLLCTLVLIFVIGLVVTLIIVYG
jgi:hypothetical protein